MGVHDGHRARKKEQFRQHGLDGFADHEVLELLLYYAIPRKDTNEIAHRLLQKFGSLQNVFAAPAEELAKVDGVGESAALFLTLVGGICQMIAGIKGIKHSKRSEKAGKLIVWGVIVAVFSVLSIVMNLVNGGEFNVVSILTGIAIPALYIYGAVLNSKADTQ